MKGMAPGFLDARIRVFCSICRYILRRVSLLIENVHVREGESEEFCEDVGFCAVFASNTYCNWSAIFR